MTTTQHFTETPHPARRAAIFLACSALVLEIGTAISLWSGASFALIFALPLLALICCSVAIARSPASRYEAVEPATWQAWSRGLGEPKAYAHRG